MLANTAQVLVNPNAQKKYLKVEEKKDTSKNKYTRIHNARERLWELQFYCKQDESCNGWTVFQYYELVCLISNVTQYFEYIHEEWFMQYYTFLFHQLLIDLKRNIRIFAQYESNVINDAHIQFVYMNAIYPLEKVQIQLNEEKKM